MIKGEPSKVQFLAQQKKFQFYYVNPCLLPVFSYYISFPWGIFNIAIKNIVKNSFVQLNKRDKVPSPVYQWHKDKLWFYQWWTGVLLCHRLEHNDRKWQENNNIWLSYSRNDAVKNNKHTFQCTLRGVKLKKAHLLTNNDFTAVIVFHIILRNPSNSYLATSPGSC